eukprot:CAMPEP_0119472788 /NCGR_PEP_ID=MMETSP1344-20130328/4706_1 /TAXON_ID=236787 /ORGANISM="Florenciella parvula, Strain CCMP2471" /LENGTH=54 /DNA_ID=CAMNT_0007505795 /DNA_START=662 /DNA_END=826 /DNA_ORIENTATION=+
MVRVRAGVTGVKSMDRRPAAGGVDGLHASARWHQLRGLRGATLAAAASQHALAG